MKTESFHRRLNGLLHSVTHPSRSKAAAICAAVLVSGCLMMGGTASAYTAGGGYTDYGPTGFSDPTVIGTGASATNTEGPYPGGGGNATVIGANVHTSGYRNVAIGFAYESSNENRGPYTSVTGNNNAVVGGGNTVVNGSGNASFGIDSSITGDNSSVLGAFASVTADNSTAIGYGSTATEDNVVSFGNTDTTRRLVYVSDGVNDNDAVNKKQLDATLASAKSYADSLNEGLASTDLDNLTDTGVQNIKNIAKDAVTLKEGDHVSISSADDGNGGIVYTVGVKTDGKIAEGDTGIVSGGAIYDELRPVDGAYVKKGQSTAENLGALDTQVKTNTDKIGTWADGTYISADKTIGENLASLDQSILVHTDGQTTTIDPTGTSTTIDISGANGDRVMTGVTTDASDRTSASNVGYVNDTADQLRSEMSSGFDGVYSSIGSVRNEVGRVAAGAAALAGIDYLPYEEGQKLNFAVGFGSYKGEQATALGMKYYFNRDFSANLATTLGYNENMISGGLSFRFGSGGHKKEAAYDPMIAQKLAADDARIQELEARNAEQEARIAKLEAALEALTASSEK